MRSLLGFIPLCFALASALGGLAGPRVFAAAPAAAVGGKSDLRLGIGGRYRPGVWTPLWVVRPEAQEKQPGLKLCVTTIDGDGQAVRYEPIPSPGSSSEEPVPFVVRLAGPQSALRVELLDESTRKSVWQRDYAAGELPPAARSTQRLMVALSQGEAMEASRRLRPIPADQRDLVSVVHDGAGLPSHWIGYDGIDTVIAAADRSGLLASLHPVRLAALKTWVKQGGKLILFLDPEYLASPEGRQGPLGDLLPTDFAGSGELTNLRDLEAFVQTGELPDDFPLEAPLRIALLKDRTGAMELTARIQGRETPLVVRRAHGLGQITYVTFHPAQWNAAKWPRWSVFLARVLGDAPDEASSGDDASEGSDQQLGYADLSGQLRTAMDQFPRVWHVPFGAIAGMALLYLLWIGPVDYYLLKRLGGRMQLTWLTFPLATAIFGGIAAAICIYGKGDAIQVNQAAVVDIDAGSGEVRGSLVAHVYSPQNQAYDITLSCHSLAAEGSTEPALPREQFLSWHGLPGSGLGGMDAPRLTQSLAAPYEEQWIGMDGAHGLGPARMPIAVWSTKSLLGRWRATIEPFAGTQLTSDKNGLAGRVVNPFPFELREAALVWGTLIYTPGGSLKPGGSFELNEGITARDLKQTLTRRRIIDLKDSKDVSLRWDPGSTDVGRIMEILLLYRAAGGRTYTGLSDRLLSHLDMSDQGRLGRAVLVGRVYDRSLCDLTHAGQSLDAAPDSRYTTVRVIFPVQAAEPVSPASSPASDSP